MKMDLLDNGCLKILLTEDDLRGFCLTYDELDYSNENTKDVLRHLLDIARDDTGFDPSGSIVVEVLPVDGGCLILMTPAAGKRHVRMKRAAGPYIYELEGADDVLDLARCISPHLPPLIGSSLYRFGGRYRLVLYPGAPLSKEMGHLLHEYASAAGEGDAAAAYTAEHGAAVAIGDALAKMCQAF